MTVVSPSSPSATEPGAGAPRRARLLALTEPGPLQIRWLLVIAASLVVAGLYTLLWPGAPTYDPWAWIIWGREIIEGDLVTTTGPSWKPLPMLFTIPFALFGDAAPDLWLWIARATALIGLVAVADLAARLGGRLAAALAVLALVTTPLYYAYGVNGSSEGMLVLACCLAATSWLDDRRNAAFWWLVAASLLRPEVWPFVALMGLERLKDRPQRLWWLVAAGALVVLTWLVPEKLGSGAYFRASTRANAPNPDSAAFASSPTLEVLGSMSNLLLWLPGLGVLLAGGLGSWLWRRGERADRTPLVARSTLRTARFLFLAALGWVVLVAAMTEGGYAGNPRYLAAPLGLLVAVGIGGIAWATRLLATKINPSGAELFVVAALLIVVVAAGLRLPQRQANNAYQAANRSELTQLASDPAVKRSVRTCRPIASHPLMIPPIAWSFHLHVNEIGFHLQREGTFIVGRNVRSSNPQPQLPGGTALRTVARSNQITILQSCAP